MALSLQKWLQLIEAESDIYNDSVVSVEEIGKLFDKYSIKQREISNRQSLLYKYLTKSVGTSTDGESSTKETILSNVMMTATDTGDDVAINLKVACSKDASNNTKKTGIMLIEQEDIISSVAALCGFSIDSYTVGKSLLESINESGFDWGPLAVEHNGKACLTCIASKVTTTTARVYMPYALVIDLIEALDRAGLYEPHPEALAPHYNQMHVYSFDNRFPNIPDKYVAKVQALVDNFNIDIYNNYIAIAISDEGIRLWLFYADYRPAYRQTYNFKYRQALFNTNQIVENVDGTNGTLILTVENYESGNHYTNFDIDSNGVMSQGPVKTYNYFSDTNFKIHGDAYVYDNLGYDFRKIEGSSVGEYKIGGSTAGWEDIYQDPNAEDLRDVNIEEEFPTYWGNRLIVSTPDSIWTTDGYPDADALNFTTPFIPVKIKKGAVDTTMTQADIMDGVIDDSDINVPKVIDDTNEMAPEIGSDLIFKPTETPINTPALPSDTMSGSETTGMFNAIFNLDDANLRNFAGWMYGTDFSSFVQNLVLKNAIDGVISLKHIYKTPRTLASISNLKFLGQVVSSNVQGYICAQYKAFSCGHLKINPYYKNVNDYTSTSIQVFLPFIGFQELNVSEIMDRWIEVKYYVDYLTGTCVAYVLCSKTNTDNSGYVMLTKQGNCSVEMPLSSIDYTNAVRNIINLGVAAATGSEALAMPSIMNSMTGAMAPTLNRGGGIGANSGSMGIKKPYIIINRQIAYDALQRQHFEGLPNNANVKLSTCKGYTRVKYINLEGIDCTEDEKTMILNKLKEGVFI